MSIARPIPAIGLLGRWCQPAPLWPLVYCHVKLRPTFHSDLHVDVYIDDFIGLTVDIENTNNATCLERALLLGLTAVSHEVSPIEPLPHDNMDAMVKLKAKTGLTKIKVILG